MALFACGVIASGLAAIHFIWLHPSVIGPFALPIGMTPLVMLFEYSLEVPVVWVPVGTVLAVASWLVLLRNPPGPTEIKMILLGGGALVALAALIVFLASASYNVGMAGEIPAEWETWVRPASRIGEVGLLLLATGLLGRATLRRSSASGEP
jgi:hypothetical protein